MHLDMGHEEGAPGKPYRKMRRFTVPGITLEQALLFENDEWCDLFFSSFRQMNNKYHHKMLYLKWDVEKSRLARNTVSWELIAAGQTGYTIKGGSSRGTTSIPTTKRWPHTHPMNQGCTGTTEATARIW